MIDDARDALIHDLFVWLADAAQHLRNSADYEEAVSKECAAEISRGVEQLSDRWADLLREQSLSAAAPDMLAALEEVIRFVDSAGSEHINRVPFVAARAAVAKARGRK